MKIYKITYVFYIFLLLIGCENELEINPTNNLPGELAFSSEANIAAILVGTYDEAGQAATYGGDLQIFTDLLGTSDQTFWSGTFQAFRQAFQKNVFVDNGFVDDIWSNAYETINQANLVLDNLEIVTSSPDEKDRIEGEAKFLRALNYLDLVRNFSSPYIAGQANTQPGVPLRLVGIVDYAQTQEIARSSVDEI
ncbi:MAG: RagB/SusD family nutrient uptake outer membrane protein, partial [Flavobacteriales bacterium]